jgi:hypothetical protein
MQIFNVSTATIKLARQEKRALSVQQETEEKNYHREAGYYEFSTADHCHRGIKNSIA